MRTRLELAALIGACMGLAACLPGLPGGDELGEDPGGSEALPMVGGGDFLIDAHEVRVADYYDFLEDSANHPSALPALCDGKQSAFLPESWHSQLERNDAAETPVVGVDWCDAWAYCEWAGKHMCGLVGGEPATLEQAGDPALNEWFRACTGDGTNFSYPYGNTHDQAACNGAGFDGDPDAGAVVSVASLPGCEGGYGGLFDMSGNVWEWTNECGLDEDDEDDEDDDGPVFKCRRRGGSYASSPDSLRCAGDNLREPLLRTSTTGIRCCQLDASGG
ncbi:protein kinase, putative [Plesiocystis pacifica SIR-1]|uniref:Protein kinase, putative n=1 Tax=Plesiocystis pacifica SIR-1 TaxID=391625 RepID=A6GKG3_9BACT|nr:SUMF1/EgtB/PvdO family nonheme iron enzyme [Plesiocystis pacifica]EDM73639.1 protein kinase, putative [Plesiocystis pacifica SIR-1]